MVKRKFQIAPHCIIRRGTWLDNDAQIEEFKQKLKRNSGLQKVGEGTYGAVFSCESPNKTKVALKKINSGIEKNGFSITAIREIKFLKSLDHPNIVRLFDVISVTEEPKDEKSSTVKPPTSIYLVFEYLEHDLAGLLGNRQVLISERHIKFCIKNILKGLVYLHDECNLIHRDVKGSNVLIGHDGSIKLADFGLSRQYFSGDDVCYTNRVVTLWYRAPELLLGEKRYGPAVDIWSTGCVFAEMIFGRPTFPGETEMQQLTLICKLVGSPTEDNYKGLGKLPVKVKEYPRTMHTRYAKLKTKWPNAYDLMEKLLEIDPKKRITAADALNHIYLKEDPLPEPLDLRGVISSHDFETRARRKRQ